MPYTSPPVRWDHELIVGDTYLPGVVTLKDAAGAVYDISGSSGTVELRLEPGAAVALTATYTLSTNGTDGKFYWIASAATTALLAPGVYKYAARITFSDATVRTVIEGDCTVRRTAVG